jgi:hypothetical protein
MALARSIGGAQFLAMKLAATLMALSLPAGALAEQIPTTAIIVAQAGVTFGPSDDRGPRYDPGSDR